MTQRPHLPNAADLRLIVHLDESPWPRALWGISLVLGSALLGLLFWMATR